MQRFGKTRIMICLLAGVCGLASLFLYSTFAQPSGPESTSLPSSQTPDGGKKPEDDSVTATLKEAERLRSLWDEQSLFAAIDKYEQTAAMWQSSAPEKAARSLKDAGDVYFILSKYEEALRLYRRALTLGKKAQDKKLQLEVLNSTAYALIYLGKNQQARQLTARVREAGKLIGADATAAQRLEAAALNNLGEINYAEGNLEGSLKFFVQAAEIWTTLKDQRGLALAHLNQGFSYTDVGDLQEGNNHFSQSLVLWRQLDDRRGIALATTALGGIYAFRGDKQKALDSHTEALKLLRLIGDRQGEAAALNGVAQAYEDAGQYQLALENYQRAFDLNREIHNQDFMALDQYYIGRVYALMNENSKGRESYQAGLALSHQVGDRQIEAHILRGLGIIESAEGKNTEALNQFKRALSLYTKMGDRRSKAYTLNAIGHLYAVMGQQDLALDFFQQALPLVREAEDKKGESLTLYNLASIARERGNLAGALSFIKDSLHIIESARTKIDSTDLRTSYFAQTHQHYELYIDLLMQLAKQQPGNDDVANGLLVSEQSRARALLDTLILAGAGLNESSRNELQLREQKLAEQIEAKVEYRMRLLSKNSTAPEARQISDEIRLLDDEYQQLRGEIRRINPRYAGFTQPEFLTVQQIKDQLDPANELLLEFSLGDRRSYLWVATRTSVQGYELPARAVIEKYAEEVYELLITRQSIEDGEVANQAGLLEESDSKYKKQAAALSSILLGPVAAQLGSKRLIIVADGALQRIPFEALPTPSSESVGSTRGETRLLIDDHEIVQVPSVSVLAAIRQERPTRSDDKTILVMADPVYDQDDPRVTHSANGSPGPSVVDEGVRKVSDPNQPGEEPDVFARLTGSLREAKSIMELTSPGEATLVTGFEASRSRIMGDELKHYRVVHFATHGILNNEHPEDSALILAMVDKDGHSQNGYLKLRDVYGLDIGANLVVLSACRTRLGHTIEGEGAMGLSRAFLYAGSRSVIASLWKVDDEATAELMKTFYTSLLSDGLPPAAALRKAKQTLRAQRRWQSPYFWAAFVLDGEYTDSLAKPKRFPYFVIYIALIVLLITVVTVWRRRKRKVPFA